MLSAATLARRWLLPLVSFFMINAAVAQGAPSSQHGDSGRKKIGLVLSGGGARGGAHLGVLRMLREARVPIDVIAGTSIGAVIGGLYASGRTVEDIEAYLSSAQWEDLLRESTPRQTRSFRRKRDDDLFLVKGRSGWGGRDVRLPRGLIQGQQFDLLLTRWTLPAAGVTDFDQLPIPFRAVAADLVNGDAVVLRSGNLARALRASLTIPTVIAPIEIDDRFLVDGGITNNLPVDVARAMGAEIIIAVDASSGLLTRDEINSVIDVTNQLINMLGRRGTQRQIESLGADDILIRPALGNQRAADFDTWPATIPIGYAAAAAERGRLDSLAVSPAAYQAFMATRQPRQSDAPVVEFVELNNGSAVADSVIESRLQGIQVGKPLDPGAIEAAIGVVYGLELFENVDYAVTERDGQTGLVIDATPKSWGPNYLQLGMAYSSAGRADARFALAASYLATAINRWGAEWRSTLAIGDEPAFATDLYQPLGFTSRFFVQGVLRAQDTLVNTFSGGERIAQTQIGEVQVDVAAGREFGDWGEFRLGLRNGQGDRELVVGDSALAVTSDFERGEVYARFTIDELDSAYFPRSGGAVRAEWLASRSGLGADEEFEQLQLRVAGARTWGRHTIYGGVRYNTTLSGTAPLQSQFRLGGFFDIGGLEDNELSGQQSGRVLASYYRRIGNIAFLPAYAGVTVEAGNVWQNRSAVSLSSTIFGGSVWVGADTPIGPFYLAYGHAETGEDAFYVFLGPVF